jgi:fatty-acyl-CoA synthase
VNFQRASIEQRWPPDSPVDPVVTPTGRNRPRTLVEALEALPATAERGFRFRALDGTERYYQWRELVLEARRRGALLLDAGLCNGDRLALVIPEPHEFVLTFLGAVMAGIVPVPMYPPPGLKAKSSYIETVAHIVQAAGAGALVTMEAAKSTLEPLIERAPELESILTVERVFRSGRMSQTPVRAPRIEPQDLCFLQFTSGSTSMPKGVMVSHQNLIANADAFLGPDGAARREDDVTVTWLPLFHDMGLVGFVLGTLIHEIPTVLLPTEAFARRSTIWMQAMHDYRATITFAPNFAYALAVKRTRDKDLDGLDLSRIRIAGCGAEPIRPHVLRAFAERFSRVGFEPRALMPSYGMAEATLAISFHQHGTPMLSDRVSTAAMKIRKATPADPSEDCLELASCGRAFPGHALEIVDENGRALPEREVGEIRVQGPSVSAGYYHNPAATLESFRDGWLHTGDLGYLANGNLYVCGRIKDLIIIRGANFYPQDIEQTVADLPGLRRDNVVAFSVLVQGEETLVIAAEGSSADAVALRNAIGERIAATIGLAAGHVAVVRVGSLPKTSSGKVQRRRTKQLFEQGLLEEHLLGCA